MSVPGQTDAVFSVRRFFPGNLSDVELVQFPLGDFGGYDTIFQLAPSSGDVFGSFMKDAKTKRPTIHVANYKTGAVASFELPLLTYGYVSWLAPKPLQSGSLTTQGIQLIGESGANDYQLKYVDVTLTGSHAYLKP